MDEQPEELKKLVAVANDMGISIKLRTEATKLIGSTRTREALLALLSIAANEKLTKGERELSLKQAREIIKSEH